MNVARLLWSGVAYLLFLASVVWAIAFIAIGIDAGAIGPPPVAVAFDAGLLGLFAVQHSLMARAPFKRWWAASLPQAWARSTYVLLASAVLILVFWQWRPIGGSVWRVEWAPLWVALWAVYATGWAIVFASTFMVDHLELLGLRQRAVPFKERWLYAWVRHPMMLGLLVAFWATPRMSWGHLLFAGLGSAYIFVATLALEERDLRQSLGADYESYRRRVPAFFPIFGRSLRSRA